MKKIITAGNDKFGQGNFKEWEIYDDCIVDPETGIEYYPGEAPAPTGEVPTNFESTYTEYVTDSNIDVTSCETYGNTFSTVFAVKLTTEDENGDEHVYTGSLNTPLVDEDGNTSTWYVGALFNTVLANYNGTTSNRSPSTANTEYTIKAQCVVVDASSLSEYGYAKAYDAEFEIACKTSELS